MSSKKPPIIPMTENEFWDIVRSHLLHWICILIFAVVAAFLSAKNIIPFGIDTSILMAVAVGYLSGAKLFPDSGLLFSRRFRNYRRRLKGKPLLDESGAARSKYNYDYREG